MASVIHTRPNIICARVCPDSNPGIRTIGICSGYMSPEYAMEGLFSVKSDVYSFGVLLLEIISGKKISSYYDESSSTNLVGHLSIHFLTSNLTASRILTWQMSRAYSGIQLQLKLFHLPDRFGSCGKKDDALEIVDESMVIDDDDSDSSEEIVKCIHIGLLCVQELTTDRPTMSTVVSMLGNEIVLPSPGQPAYTIKKNNIGADNSTMDGAISVNEESVSTIGGR